MRETVVVVPDGLAADENGNTLEFPSFAYRAVLDYVRERFHGHQVILAPANTFGSNKAEQEVAALYLGKFDTALIVCPSPCGAKYIDTRGNADLLRDYLRESGRWPLGEVLLACAFRHSARAALCFKKAGFCIKQVVAIHYEIPKEENIVGALFYYRIPAAHWLYEKLAHVRDFLKMAYAPDHDGRRK